MHKGHGTFNNILKYKYFIGHPHRLWNTCTGTHLTFAHSPTVQNPGGAEWVFKTGSCNCIGTVM